jgi:hypothetical protein
MILHKSEKKVATKSMASAVDLSMQQKKVDKVMKEYKGIFSSLIGVPLHFQVNHPIYLTPNASLPNGPVYHRSLI